METKFYVGQKVKDERFGFGTVKSISHDSYNKDHTVYVEFDEHLGCSYRPDGSELSHPPILFPADPEPFRLTEWQRNKIYNILGDHFNGELNLFHATDKIESILSEPEPPKYQPKQGDLVLVRDKENEAWIGLIFIGMDDIEYKTTWLYGEVNWNMCRPFDASLVGKITND